MRRGTTSLIQDTGYYVAHTTRCQVLRRSYDTIPHVVRRVYDTAPEIVLRSYNTILEVRRKSCLLYTSDAADE